MLLFMNCISQGQSKNLTPTAKAKTAAFRVKAKTSKAHQGERRNFVVSGIEGTKVCRYNC